MEETNMGLNNSGSGYGYGSGDGDGYGYGSGSGDNSGYGSGYGYGYGSGDGDGYGYGDGSGSGSGYGVTMVIPESVAWMAYHYIDKSLMMRNRQTIKVGEKIHEDKIIMCSCGLHASLCPLDAQQYRPPDSVLTKVKVWGRVIVGRDKLVATDRMIIEILSPPSGESREG